MVRSLPRLRRLAALALLGSCTLLAGCRTLAGPSADLDTVSVKCRTDPLLCVSAQADSYPLPTLSPTLASAGQAASAAVALEAKLRHHVEEVLMECANEAEQALTEYPPDGKAPDKDWCNKVLAIDAWGNEVTRAMRQGRKKHAYALACVQERMGPLMEGQFTVEPRYRFDEDTGKLEHLTPEQVNELLRDRRSFELTGTLEPDVVIHALGDLLKILAVYDFKFPCPTENRPLWGRFTPRSPYYGRSQGVMYRTAFGQKIVWIVSPGERIVR